MSVSKQDVKLSLKVITNKERNKVLFAETDNHFVDTLLSFLTLPLGRIIKLLDSHCRDEAATIGSLSSLHRSLANLDTSHFWTGGAKEALLNPKSSTEAEYEMLKLDISDSPPARYFTCHNCTFRSVSMYYDNAKCVFCDLDLDFGEEEEGRVPADASGSFITNMASSFIISDDLQIFPSVTGLCQIVGILGIKDEAEAEAMEVTIGLNEMLRLLKASFISPTPLSNLILKKASVILDSEPKTSVDHIEIQENPKSKNIVLKVMVQKSSGKFLYAQAEEDFVDFLVSLLYIPLGGVHHLLSSKTCVKALDNLYRSAADLKHKYFRCPDMRNKLMKPNVVHGCISEDYILPLFEEPLPKEYRDFQLFSSKLLKGKGRYLRELSTYFVMDDLTVTPSRMYSIFTSLNEQRIPMSDVKEIEVQIGAKEGLSILKAALTSTSALTDALLNKQPKSDMLNREEAKSPRSNKKPKKGI